jgi:hypothetical protein
MPKTVGNATIADLWIAPDLSKLGYCRWNTRPGPAVHHSERFFEAAVNEGGIAHDHREIPHVQSYNPT